MTTTETLKLALEALEPDWELAEWYVDELREKAITALREALASEAIEQKAGIKQVIELYDSPDQPTQRQARSADTWVNATTWRGLTDEEIDQGLLRSDYAFKTAEAWRAGVVFAMTKLKEKNCG